MRRVRAGRWAAVAALGCVVALVPAAVGLEAVGAVVEFAVCGGGSAFTTCTNSTKHVTTNQRSDLPDAPAPECGFPGAPSSLVSETSTDLDPKAVTTLVLGPATIYVGEDQKTPFDVPAGNQNFDTLITYEKVVTQYFQATAAGDPCVLVSPSFTG